MGVSLKDVAALAGVSVKTVSNVVNDYAHVSEQTRAKVRQAITELGYQPNLTARHLRYGRSGIIALALPELDIPYFSELARSVIGCAEAQSWAVLIEQTEGLRERELLIASGLRSRTVDGVILSPLALDSADLAQLSTEMPVVLLGERIGPGAADHVVIDNIAAARAATEHLIGLGRRRIAAIGARVVVGQDTSNLRLAGYAQALNAARIQLNPDLVVPVPSYHRTPGADAMAALLALPEPPDAVFCFNDLLALGALRTLLARGLRVPEDVALVGVDDIEDGRFSTPTLTTIRPDKTQIASVAVNMLLERINGADMPAREFQADFTLQIRESTIGRAAD
ncbi:MULTISPECIES: LacI family DNA-binding transcriptional regulator [unclassified Crossiella]|uniref:LacI family DNA-binding transcriptional regulator n=1 Tax=unclassified Crossiella TaxID=2620835 RepID=UPI001FFF171A|nr:MULTISPECIES: LacI family DNA-binding transcriptional regulator [unclassified Crossiella]MCK2239660.1 LacI family transcriptional regulator [Crossiella sp. S99.2]MCK2252355.1 LacI family transcriptional regulator [Crossiella sp. S99.1]